MNRPRPFLALLLVLAPFACAASLDRDLGRGLTYHRIHELPADLPTNEAHHVPCVLDLRYVRPETGALAAATETLVAWLKFHATPHAPVFILANADTSAALLAPFLGRDTAGSIVVIGPAAPGFNPDLAVKISPGADRRAYDALENGANVDALLVETTDKPRNDEAQLARDRLLDPAPPPVAVGLDAAPGDPAPADVKPAKPKPPAPLIDVALQRAVQLHRTLLALKKL